MHKASVLIYLQRVLLSGKVTLESATREKILDR
jgi:hypothetical protein